MNIVDFAEKAGAKSLVFMQSRDHVEKDSFRKLFTVLDA